MYQDPLISAAPLVLIVLACGIASLLVLAISIFRESLARRPSDPAPARLAPPAGQATAAQRAHASRRQRGDGSRWFKPCASKAFRGSCLKIDGFRSAMSRLHHRLGLRARRGGAQELGRGVCSSDCQCFWP